MQEDIIRIQDLKTILRCGNDKVYELCHKKDFPQFKVGNTYYIIYSDFIEWARKESHKTS